MTKTSLARELRDHLNSAPPPDSQAPLDVTGSVTAVELDGSDRPSEEEETLPLFDHSDIFMPTPVVPPRSPRRSETPSPPADEGRRTSHQPQSTARSQFLSPTEAAESSLETQQQKPSRHKSAPLGNRSRLPQAQPAQQSVTSWAAAALIEQPNEPQEPKSLSARTWTESAAPEEPTYSRGHAPAEPTYKQTPTLSTLYRESPAITQTASQDFASVSRYSRDSARVAGHDRAPAPAKGTSQPKSQYYPLAARDSRAEEPLENTYEQAQAFSQLDSQESAPASRYNQPQEASYHRAKAPVESVYSQCAAPAQTETLDFASASKYKREHKPTVTSDRVPAQVFAIPPAVGPALGQAEQPDCLRIRRYGIRYALGRNCRFLQGPGMDPNSVRRLAQARKAGKELSEVLVNYRRDGSPFMDLLMIAPLMDSRGNIRYYIGAQVDVSGLIKDCSGLDGLLRVVEEEQDSEGSAYIKEESRKDEFQELSEMFDSAELERVRRHGGSMHKEYVDENDAESTSHGRRRRRLLLNDPSQNALDAGQRDGGASSIGSTVKEALNGKLDGVYQHVSTARHHMQCPIELTSCSTSLCAQHLLTASSSPPLPFACLVSSNDPSTTTSAIPRMCALTSQACLQKAAA
ncbi:hypothetical protein LTS14_010846 [Recurvomyces mirabilis]|uniref:uncharacterized protein n=1 Tax=Recurvomyces mirabilis TaxID=574656 RepID=UPI002DE07A22|nr:hypothetical protein LTS14_010846 [Recurvomyces mirabilis]